MSALALMILLGAKADPGLDAYKQGKFQRAVELLSASLATMSASDRGGAYEIGVREKLVLSLYAMKKEESAIAEYHELKRRFPGFAFDADRMSPETLAFFDRHPPPAKPVEEVKAAPTSSTDAQPRVV